MSQAATAPLPPPDARTVLDRLGGWRGVVDGGVPPALFVAGSTGAGLLGHDEREARDRVRLRSALPRPGLAF